MIKSVAYIRVSTLKEEQTQSLQNQRDFFEEYITKRGETLVEIYSDKGKSATKMKNRDALQRLIRDAKSKKFEKLYVKDISRMFRNTLDFITFTRELMDKHGIILHLLNFGEGKDIDTFTLNLMAMIAEHESKKISERIKFGKRISKQDGVVPNFVFGYDHIDRVTLQPNDDAKWVKKIYELYTEKNYGMARIATFLFENHVKTSKLKDGKPNYIWSPKTLKGILSNPIYTGLVINGRETTKELYSGRREAVDPDKWYRSERPEFRLVTDEQFEKAQELIEKNKDKFPSIKNGARGNKGARECQDQLFSNLLKCNVCGGSYRRYERQYTEDGPVYAYWVCNGRNRYGKARCTAEHIRIEEADIKAELSNLFAYLITDKKAFFKLVEAKASVLIKEYLKNSSDLDVEGLELELKDLQTRRNNTKEMIAKGLLSVAEGADDMKKYNAEIEHLTSIINQGDVSKDLAEKIKINLADFFKNFDEFSFTEGLDNAGLKVIVKEIRVLSATDLQVQFNVDGSIEGLFFPLTLTGAGQNTTVSHRENNT